jgi:hypothetical protein
MIVSMKLHVQNLRSLEDSERTRRACLTYLQNWYHHFYAGRPEVVAELQSLALQLQGHLEVPSLRWKYAWMKPAFGWKAANWTQNTLPQLKASWIRRYDEAMYEFERRGALMAVPPGMQDAQRE